MVIAPTRADAYQLLHDGAIALSEIQSNGIGVDIAYLDRVIKETGEHIERLEAELMEDSLWSDWVETFGRKAKITARQQLGEVLFNALGYEVKDHQETEGGQAKTDADTLEQINEPFVHKWLEAEKYRKMRNTFLAGIRREVSGYDGRVHSSYSLNIAKTYRSSSFEPNSQNWPIRDPVMGAMIRSAFVAGEGNVIVEMDYGQIEVRTAACYNHDPVLIDYICDPTRDMHRDMSVECFKLPKKLPADFWKQDGKRMRFFTKNQFVFPQFYGSYYVDCARALWASMEHDDFKVGKKRVVDLLKENGIHKRGACNPDMKPMIGTFEYHIKQVQDYFWNKRFTVYRDWKNEWYQKYLKRGYYDTLTGFRIGGVMRKNDVINYGIQGSAFHCLLWSVIEVMKEIKRRKMRSKIIGQIHDSMLAEVPVSELGEFLKMARVIMVKKVRKHWKWITVPLEVEAEATPPGGSWHEKKEVAIDG